MLKKPVVMLPIAFVTLVYCILDYSFPVMKLLSLGITDVQGAFSSMLYLLRLLLRLLATPVGLAAVVGGIVLASMVLTLVFSGCFNMIGLSLDGRKNLRGQYIKGIRRHYPRLLIITLIVLTAAVLFFLLIAVALVPALIVTNTALGGKPGYFGVAVIVDIITAFVFFFSILFFRIYTSFWYPSAVMFGKKAFRAAKHVADSRFWGLVGRFFLMDSIMVFLFISFAYMGSSLPVLPIKWILLTISLSFMVIYVFALFRDSLRKAGNKQT